MCVVDCYITEVQIHAILSDGASESRQAASCGRFTIRVLCSAATTDSRVSFGSSLPLISLQNCCGSQTVPLYPQFIPVYAPYYMTNVAQNLYFNPTTTRQPIFAPFTLMCANKPYVTLAYVTCVIVLNALKDSTSTAERHLPFLLARPRQPQSQQHRLCSAKIHSRHCHLGHSTWQTGNHTLCCVLSASTAIRTGSTLASDLTLAITRSCAQVRWTCRYCLKMATSLR